MAETVGFEPTDGINRQTISSRSRYDLFDTSPDIINSSEAYMVLETFFGNC